ncbi:MAG TPA: hypothetical protein VGS80_26240 [Ktedonobacterales bacterium]|nr:hypothetical protein [Ktedonobacterales bacterium]
MVPQSRQRSDPAPPSGPRHRRYRVLGSLPAVLLLAAGAFLGLAQGAWILFDGAALYLLISVVMIATDSPPRRPPETPPVTAAAPPGDDRTAQPAEQRDAALTPAHCRSSALRQ